MSPDSVRRVALGWELPRTAGHERDGLAMKRSWDTVLPLLGVLAARQADCDLPDDLIPFMIVGGQQFSDYYGFPVLRRTAAGAAELPVLVWCIHAYVHGWDTGFGAFLDELQAQHARQRQADPGAAPDWPRD